MNNLSHRWSKRFTVSTVAGAAAAVLLCSSTPASAQEPAPQVEQAPPPPGVYQTPMYQQTQGSYVPQSVAMSGPRVINDYDEGDPIPPGYHVDTRIRKGLVVGGAVAFGVCYFFSALVAAAGQDSSNGGSNNESALWIPAIGPFIQMANNSSAIGNVFLVIDGIAQAGGLAMLVGGLVSPKTVLVRNDLGFHVTPMPMQMGKNGGGFGLAGTF